mgnify:CR=1 FL=1
MKKKKRLVILMAICLVFTILICFFTLFVPWYNNNYPTFQYYDKEILYNYQNEYEYNQKNFYKEYVNYSLYEEKYRTVFFYWNCADAFLPSFYALYNECYSTTHSYIIFLDNDYEDVKNYLLSTIEKVDIYVGLDKYTPVKEVEVDGTIYHRIYWQVQSEREKSIYLSEPCPNTFYFFSYNSDLKYIAFSIAHSFEPIMFSDIDNLKRMIRLNFNYNF